MSNIIIEQILKGMEQQLVPFDCYYYRTRKQAEIDLVLEGRFGTIPIEIKASNLFNSKMLINLKNFINDFGSPFGILINNGERIRILNNNIYLIPASYL